MNVELSQNELKILASALKVKVDDQYQKLINPHLDGRFVPLYQTLHQEAAALHVKLARQIDVSVPAGVDPGRVGQNEHDRLPQ